MLHPTVHAPDPTNRSSVSATNTRNSGTQPIVIPHQPVALGATPEVHWFYGLCLSISIPHDFPGIDDTPHSKIPPTP